MFIGQTIYLLIDVLFLFCTLAGIHGSYLALYALMTLIISILLSSELPERSGGMSCGLVNCRGRPCGFLTVKT
jgi:hypothetical protein